MTFLLLKYVWKKEDAEKIWQGMFGQHYGTLLLSTSCRPGPILSTNEGSDNHHFFETCTRNVSRDLILWLSRFDRSQKWIFDQKSSYLLRTSASQVCTFHAFRCYHILSKRFERLIPRQISRYLSVSHRPGFHHHSQPKLCIVKASHLFNPRLHS